MKNSEMKVSRLLEQKARIESEINALDEAVKSLSGDCVASHYFGDVGFVRLSTPGSVCQVEMSREIMLKAVKEMLEIKTKELEPISKKLEAIELMLNS